ncbi:MAG TPA: DNA methyltransferase, partial [Planctomycetota bacterium]|nr:DNA methyltransferase [Planctomycetota bacterium]
PHQRLEREKLVAAVAHKLAAGLAAPAAAADLVRDMAFTALNRFVALRMLEARELVQECIARGDQSAGFKEFCLLAPGLALLPDRAGYRLYLECLFDELSTEVKVLFDRRDLASVLWPRRETFDAVLAALAAPELAGVWREDETIGWVYQYFNGQEERRAMREASAAPRDSRELAVRNQFFTPRYVVEFLTDNTLGRIWYEMRRGTTRLVEQCAYLVRRPGEIFLAKGEKPPAEASSGSAPVPHRAPKDPRDLRVLDPACGSGHFLLYAFGLLLAIYEEAWSDPEAPASAATGKPLREDYATLDDLRRAAPGLILRHNLHGVDIDPRCSQIAALALWMRAQRAYKEAGIGRAARPPITRTNIVTAEPLAADAATLDAFAATLEAPVLGKLVKAIAARFALAGELGLLLRVEQVMRDAVAEAVGQREIDFTGADRGHVALHEVEQRLEAALRAFAASSDAPERARRRLFRDDAEHGLALLETAGQKYDAVLMNPPFGACSAGARRDFERAYPRTKNDIFAAFVERGIELLTSRGRVGAITSRTGFFLSSFQKWREEVLLQLAPPAVVADLGVGVLDSAMVETAAYCLESKR